MKRRDASARGGRSRRDRDRQDRGGATAHRTPGPANFHGSATPSANAERIFDLARHVVAALFVLAAIAVALGPHRVGDYFTETDFYGAYADGARLIQQGVVDPSRYGVVGPVYEVVLAALGFVVRDLFLAAELISVVSAGALLVIWGAILRHLAGARVALAGVLFMAVNAVLFRYGYSATTDALATALQGLALWLAITREGRTGTVGAGLAAALAFLTRYNAIYLVPAGLAIVLAREKERHGRAALAFIGGFLVLVLPWIAFSLARGGELGIQLHHNIAFEVFARPQGIVWDDYQRVMQPEFPTLWSVIARDPGAVAARMLGNVVEHARLDAAELLGQPVAWAAVAGLVLVLASGAWRTLWPVGLAGVLLFLTLVPVFHSARYSLALLPMYATLACAAFALPAWALPVAGGRVWLKALVAAIPLALALQANVAAQRETLRQLPVEVLEHAAVLRAEAAPGDRVIARKAHLGFHAGVETLAFPFADHPADLAAFAKEHGARWLYVSWPEVLLRPKIGFLLDTTATMPGLTVRHATAHHPGVLYAIGDRFGELPAWYANDTLRSYHTARAQLLVNGDNPQALYAAATVEHQRGRLAEARFYLDRLVRLTPADFSALLLLGDTALRQRDLDTAREAFSRALEQNQQSVAARIGLGWVHLGGGQPREAAGWWKPVVERTPDPGTLARMVDLFTALGDAEAAARARDALRRMGGS